MTDILGFLNANSGALTVLFTGIVTLATAFYAGLTWQLVSETRRLREVQTEPKIEISVRSVDDAIHIVRLHVRNIGLGPAINLKFSSSVVSGGDAAVSLLREFTETNFFTTGISYLGPGEERYSNFTQMDHDHDAKIASVLAFEVQYRGTGKITYRESLEIDMSELKGNYQLGRSHLSSMARSLDELQKDVHRISTGFKRLKADIYTSEDREAEKQAAIARIESDRAERST